jgi:predicted  nucleic acid-binding Zn-ribbon protein
MSEGSYVELALRDLGIEIEKLQEDRDHWHSVASSLYDEIERLRKERDHWMEQSKLLFLQLVQK